MTEQAESEFITITLGKFEVTGGHIGAWDPCYEVGGRHASFMPSRPAVNGTWEVSLLWVDGFPALLEAHSVRHRATGKRLRKIGVAEVDSGIIGIYDVAQVPDVHFAMSEVGVGQGLMTWGAYTSTAFGDGAYEVKGRPNAEGKLVSVQVEVMDLRLLKALQARAESPPNSL